MKCWVFAHVLHLPTATEAKITSATEAPRCAMCRGLVAMKEKRSRTYWLCKVRRGCRCASSSEGEGRVATLRRVESWW